MSEIPRWEVGFSQMNENDQGEFITWNDHCAALKAARNELPDVGSWSPEPKFKIGDRVYWDKDLGTVAEPDEKLSPCQEPLYVNVNWDDGNFGTVRSSDLSLCVPPSPAELIPTLKEHEWVRGTYKTKTAFGPFSVYYDEIGAKMAGDNYLIHWNTGAILDTLATLERCDAPEVK